MADFIATSQVSSGLSFTQGFLLGQISIVLLMGVLIKFFIFGEAPSSSTSHRSAVSRRRRHTFSALASSPANFQRQLLLQKKGPSALRPSPPLTVAAILAKTYYNVDHHQAESVDWFNVLIAQTLAQLRTDAQQDEAVLASLTAVLNGPRKPDWLGDVRVTEINLGDEFPIFSNCRVIPVDATSFPSSDPTTNTKTGLTKDTSTTGGQHTDGASRPTSSSGNGPASSAHAASDGTRLQARMDVDLSDTITLGIETKLLLNYPKPNTLVLPVALAVSVVRFSGTLSISFIPSPGTPAPPPPADPRTGKPGKPSSDPTPPTTLTFSFLPDYRLELNTRSLLGGRARLQDVPKIAQVIEAQLSNWFDERCVEPRFQQIVLPSLWPRKRNARGGADPFAPPGTQHQRTPSTSSGLHDSSSGDAYGASPARQHRRERTTSSDFNTSSGGISMLEVEKLRDERLRRQREAMLARQKAEERDRLRRGDEEARQQRRRLEAEQQQQQQLRNNELRRRRLAAEMRQSEGEHDDEDALDTDGTGESARAAAVAATTAIDRDRESYPMPGTLTD